MGDVHRSKGLEQAAGRWREVDIRSLLAESAMAIGAGSPTDAGVAWTLTTEVETPITMAGGIPDPATLPAKGSARSAGKRRPGDAGGDVALRRRAGLRRAPRGDGGALEPDRWADADAGQFHLRATAAPGA